MRHEQIALFEEYLHQRRYSLNTIKTYGEALKVFIDFVEPKALSEVNNDDLERFNYNRIIKRGLSSSYQNQVINALKLYYRRFHNTHFDLGRIQRPKEGNTLPAVLSLKEVDVRELLNSTK